MALNPVTHFNKNKYHFLSKLSCQKVFCFFGGDRECLIRKPSYIWHTMFFCLHVYGHVSVPINCPHEVFDHFILTTEVSHVCPKICVFYYHIILVLLAFIAALHTERAHTLYYTNALAEFRSVKIVSEQKPILVEQRTPFKGFYFAIIIHYYYYILCRHH